jgi:hypothetical protein
MDDTQTAGPATDDIGAAQTPTGEDAPSGQAAAQSAPPGFGERGRMRRRMRFLRKARELAYRDLGGLVFDLHRFGRRNDALVLAKLETIGRIDTELRALEGTLAERRPVTILREAGVAACPRCAAIHGSDDRFCPNCGLAMDLRAERPMAGPQTVAQATPAQTQTPPQPAAMPAPAPAMSPTAAHTPAPAMPPTGAHTPVPATSFPAEPPPPAPAAGAATAAVPAPGSTAPQAPTKVAPAPTTPAPSSTAPPVPATAAPAPATPAPSTTTPAQDAGPPADPAPSAGEGPVVGKDGPSVDQPTEIVRPPAKDP